MSRIAIIGAGLAGLILARELSPHHDVTVFEKSRGVGGRIATRRAGDFRFDHGAQFFTARSGRFRKFLAPLVEQDVVAPWHARFAEHTRSTITAERQWADDYPHFVGSPAMNSFPRFLATGLDIRLETQILKAERTGEYWRLEDQHTSADEFDWLFVTTPGPQAHALVADYLPPGARASAGAMKACYALMLGFEAPQDTSFDATRVLDADISWISVNSSKPGRDTPYTLVVHATNAWADANIDGDLDSAMNHLLAEFEAVSGLRAATATHTAIHRWRYANSARQDGDGYCLDTRKQLGVCGDWLIRGRVESAFLSAMRLVDQLRNDVPELA